VGQEKMLNFFVTLSNDVKIPYVTIGTPRGLALLNGVFREARRVSDMGGDIWDAFGEGGEWKHFVNGMWGYQWTKKPVELSPDLNRVLYDETQGITALVVRLFQLSQIEAIRSGTETLSPSLLHKVATQKFRVLAPMLAALRSKDEKEIRKYEDLLTNGLKSLGQDVDREAQLALLKAAKAESQTHVIAEKTRAVSALVDMGTEESAAKKLVDDAFERQGLKTCTEAVVFILCSAGAAKTAKAGDPPRKNRLKAVVDGGGKDGNGHDALRQAGIITDVRGGAAAC
jgi:hypothetical protein